uniref:Uncharacterized protein n=1 Tax=Anopheles dirus TaxID=7168 RepID=A0A182N029_9DIPT
MRSLGGGGGGGCRFLVSDSADVPERYPLPFRLRASPASVMASRCRWQGWQTYLPIFLRRLLPSLRRPGAKGAGRNA